MRTSHVAAGILPAVEPGVPPGGYNRTFVGARAIERRAAGRQDAALYGRQDACLHTVREIAAVTLEVPLTQSPNPQSAIRNPQSGFTLIELMTVLVIIGILTALIIPEMRGTFEDALLRSTARELVNVIELASSRAISLNQTIRVRLDAATGRYQVERRVRAGAVGDFAPLKDVSGSKGALDKRISIRLTEASPEDSTNAPAGVGASTALSGSAMQDNALAFYPDGTADAALILLRDRAGFRLALRVNPITSRVTILEPMHE